MPQNLKTKPAADLDDLPILSAEEQRLVELLAEGKVSNSEAYRIAYSADGYNAAALAVAACRKISSAKIQAHVRALQAVGLAKVALSRDDRIKARLAFAQRAENAGNFGAANGALDAVDKMLGHMVERFEDVTKNSDPADMLRQIAKDQPDIAASLAQQAGIDIRDVDDTKRVLN